MIYRNPLLQLKYFAPPKSRYLQPVAEQGVRASKRQEGAHVYYTGLGRHALLKGLELLKINEGDNVLVPAYICNSAIEPFLLRRVEVRYYKIKKDFSPRLESLNAVVNKNTKAVLYVNYFGLANDFESYQNFCRHNNLYLIEDNAHTLFSDYYCIRGDISIFSLRKLYPTPNGALLVAKNNKKVNQNKLVSEHIEKKMRLTDYRFIIETLYRKMYHYISNSTTHKILLKLKKRREKFASKHAEAEDAPLCERLLKLSFDIINKINSSDIINKRRDNYNFLLEELMSIKSEHLKVVFSKINDAMCPLAFPVIVEEYRESFIENLFSNGYIAYTWPDMPREVIESNNYEDEHFLSNTVVLLPVHQDLSPRHLEGMVCAIKKWVDKIERKN